MRSGASGVALLAEGVDRNDKKVNGLAARHRVALLAEGVDRNNEAYAEKKESGRRPPRGGRG